MATTNRIITSKYLMKFTPPHFFIGDNIGAKPDTLYSIQYSIIKYARVFVYMYNFVVCM